MSHDVPPELQDRLEFVDGGEDHCQECGEVMRELDADEGPSHATHYCPECAVYKSVSPIAETILGP